MEEQGGIWREQRNREFDEVCDRNARDSRKHRLYRHLLKQDLTPSDIGLNASKDCCKHKYYNCEGTWNTGMENCDVEVQIHEAVKNHIDLEVRQEFQEIPIRVFCGCQFTMIYTGDEAVLVGEGSTAKLFLAIIHDPYRTLVALKVYKKGHTYSDVAREFAINNRCYELMGDSDYLRTSRPMGFLPIMPNSPLRKEHLGIIMVQTFAISMPYFFISSPLSKALKHPELYMDKKRWAQVCTTLLYTFNVLQQNGIYHLNVTPDKIFLFHTNETELFPYVGLVDFGNARYNTKYKEVLYSSPPPLHVAPELAKQGFPSPTCDFYSLCHVFMMVHEEVFSGICGDLNYKLLKYLTTPESKRDGYEKMMKWIKKYFTKARKSSRRIKMVRFDHVYFLSGYYC